MASENTGDDDYMFECSEDEELAQMGICFNNNWIPSPEEIEQLYEQIHKNKIIALNWQSPGHRDPYQPEKPAPEPEKQSEPAKKDTELDDFDFEEDAPPSMLKLPSKSGGTGGLKFGANKKRTTLAGILSNMERHRIIERRDSGTEKAKNSPSPSSSK